MKNNTKEKVVKEESMPPVEQSDETLENVTGGVEFAIKDGLTSKNRHAQNLSLARVTTGVEICGLKGGQVASQMACRLEEQNNKLDELGVGIKKPEIVVNKDEIVPHGELTYTIESEIDGIL